jgi:hypothetical protein
VAGRLLTLSYLLENASAHITAMDNTMTISVPDGYSYIAISSGACVDGTPVLCTLPDMAPEDVVVIRLELDVESFNDGEAVATVSTFSGDYPALSDGVSDTTVTTPIIWPEILPPPSGSKGSGSPDLLWLLVTGALLFSGRRYFRILTHESASRQ